MSEMRCWVVDCQGLVRPMEGAAVRRARLGQAEHDTDKSGCRRKENKDQRQVLGVKGGAGRWHTGGRGSGVQVASSNSARGMPGGGDVSGGGQGERQRGWR